MVEKIDNLLKELIIKKVPEYQEVYVWGRPSPVFQAQQFIEEQIARIASANPRIEIGGTISMIYGRPQTARLISLAEGGFREVRIPVDLIGFVNDNRCNTLIIWHSHKEDSPAEFSEADKLNHEAKAEQLARLLKIKLYDQRFIEEREHLRLFHAVCNPKGEFIWYLTVGEVVSGHKILKQIKKFTLSKLLD